MDVFQAAKRGNLERVRALVEQDAALVHATDHDGWTPLLHAACDGHVEVAGCLLDHGAAVNYIDPYRQMALHLACFQGHAQLVSLLLRRGADVTAVGSTHGWTPLMVAAMRGPDDVVRILLEHGGSDVDAADRDGITACHWVCNTDHSCVLRQLLEAGADPTLRDANDRTSLNHASGEGHYLGIHHQCIRVLQEWHRAYTLHRARSVRDASLVVANSSAPVDAAPTYLVDRASSGLTMPTVHVSPHQQHGQPYNDVVEEGHVEVGPVAVGGVVTVYAIEELNGEVYVT